MTIDKTSLPEPTHEQHPGAVFLQDQEDGKKLEEAFLIQVMKRVREEWETFHREHPAVDEETFCQAQRFCLKQWILQRGILLRDQPAFEQAQQYVAGELPERAVVLQDTAMMLECTYREAQSWCVRITAQAQERSQRLREAIEELSSGKVSYLVSKVNQLRAPGQAQDRAKEGDARVRRVRRDSDIIKKLGIVRDYENEKEKLQKREKEIVDQVNAAGHLMRESQRSAQVAADVTRLEAHMRKCEMLLEDLHHKTLAQYRVQDAAGTTLSDWDAATRRAQDAHDQLQTFAGFVGGIQAAITTTLVKAKAEIEHVKYTQQQLQKATSALERMRKRRAKIENWAEKEMKKVEKQKRKREKFKSIPINMMIQAKNDLFSKAIEIIIQKEEQLRDALERARSMTIQAMETFQNLGGSLTEIKATQLRIAQKEAKVAHTLENVKEAFEQAARIAECYAKDAKQAWDLQTRALVLPDRGAEAAHAKEQARRTAQEEMAAYARAKTSLRYAIRSWQEIASEHRNVQETATLLEKHFTALLQGYLCWEKEVLQSAITGVKNIVKASLHVIRQEEQAQEAAHQTVTVLQRGGGDGSLSQVIASEQEALLLAALANDRLTQCAASYSIFHKLACDVAKEDFETMKDHWQDCLDVVKTYLDEIKPDKERQEGHCQRAALRSQSQAHLLIDEQTGAIILKDGVVTCFLQDLAGIGQADLQENPDQSRLVFKGGHLLSSYDVPHDRLHETSEERTSIHLHVPDGMGGHMAMLYLPNGTQINVADIDLGETEYDPARPERGVTITLKKDGGKINLLAAASVMRGLTQEDLQEQMDKSLNDSINQIRDALGTKSLEAIYESFQDAKGDDLYRKYIDTFLLSSEKAERRVKDHLEWMESIVSMNEELVCKLYEYASDVLNQEKGEKEITDEMTLENIYFGNMPRYMYQKREECLQKIAKGKGLDTIITCRLFDNPEDDSTATNLDLNGQEMLVEYERARAWQLVLQRQDPAVSGLSDTWIGYLARLRRAILDEAPAFFRTRFLVNQIGEAVQADHWEEGTQDDPGVISLAKELARGPSAIGRAGSQGNNDYARTMDVLTQRVVAGVQEALKTGCPSEIVSRVRFLDVVYGVIDFNEARITDALDPTTPTVLARAVMEQISGVRCGGTQDHGMSDPRERKER